MWRIAKRTASASGLALALGLAFQGSALADLTNFTWTPAAAVPPLVGGPIVNANNIIVSDFADIHITNATGAFTENAVLDFIQFQNTGNPITVVGFGTTFSLYATLTATGTSTGIPAAGASTTGNFTSLSYTLWGNPNGFPTVTIPAAGATPVITGNAGAFALAFGTLVNGTTTLTGVSLPGGGTGFSPTANANLAFQACTAAGQDGGLCTGNESAFFTSPLPQNINLVIGNFSATTSETTLTSASPASFLDVRGGGGNLTIQAIPEPSTLALLGSGLFALGALVRRRRRNQA
jgi:hypothetical protein